MIDKKIEIVSTGFRQYSSMGHKSRESIQNILMQSYINVKITLINNTNDLNNIIMRQPDLVFLGFKYLPKDISPIYNNDDFWISNYLMNNGIPNTGSLSRSHKIELYKDKAKTVILNNGIKTSKFFVANNENLNNSPKNMVYPMFVKPNDRGGGFGVDSSSIVYNFLSLKTKIKNNTELYGTKSLIEEYLPGREFTVSILKCLNSDNYNIMPIELIAPLNSSGIRVLSSQIKETDTEISKIVENGWLKNKISELAYKSFRAIGGRDYGRIDIRLDKDGLPNFLEANLFPSLVDNVGNYFPKSCKLYLNYDYSQTINHITDLGMKRVHNKSSNKIVPKLSNHILREPALI